MDGPPEQCGKASQCIMPNGDRSRGLWTPVRDYESRGKIKGEWGGVRASTKKGTHLIVRGIVRSVFKDN
jgi:hypothetical protein